MDMRQMAIEDGVELLGPYETCRGIRYNYSIPCELCGRRIVRTEYSRKRSYICDYCKGVIKKKKKTQMSEELKNIKTPKEMRFDRAVEKIRKQVKNFSEYEKAIEIAKTRAEYYGSIPEAMVAIELLKLKYRIIPQQKIGKYKVDFVLPNKKIVIEVDGALFHSKPNNDREATIQFSLGLDWKIIHLPAELIEKNIVKLKTVIEKLGS